MTRFTLVFTCTMQRCIQLFTYKHTCTTDHQLLEKKGKIVFVDLAGSERLRDTGTKGKVTVNMTLGVTVRLVI